MSSDLTDLNGRIAVVTGGASGIGKGIAEALLEQGATVVIADVEEPAIDKAVGELSPLGTVEGVVTDVSKPESLEALADHVFGIYGACHLLFNNAGVTSGGGGLPWEQEPTDWQFVMNVNVLGVAYGVVAFLPRMIASGEPGCVINTSSGDGGFAPVAHAAVYATSKAAVSCLTEAIAQQLVTENANVRASVFYPSGGLLDTGLYDSNRNRPQELARKKTKAASPTNTFAELKKSIEEKIGAPVPVMDLLELGRFAVQGVKDGRYVIGLNMDQTGEMLKRRADQLARCELPTSEFGL